MKNEKSQPNRQQQVRSLPKKQVDSNLKNQMSSPMPNGQKEGRPRLRALYLNNAD